MHDAKPNRARNVVALTIVAVALAVMFVGAIMPTPLYPLYQRAFGFSGITLTLIYAVYVLGNLVALLFFGRLADQVGRRSAILPAIGFGIASTVVFAAAAGTAWLFAARALSGFSTGLAAGAATRGSPSFTPAAATARRADRGVGEFFRLRRGAALRRLAGAIRAVAAAAALSRLSGFALCGRRRHPVRARNGHEPETLSAKHRCGRGSACRGPFGSSSCRPR